MAVKGEVGWKRRTELGAKLNIVARRYGGQWLFYQQTYRFEKWEPLENPPLEDWLELLDAVQRRMQRRKQTPQEIARIRRTILERFPGTKLD